MEYILSLLLVLAYLFSTIFLPFLMYRFYQRFLNLEDMVTTIFHRSSDLNKRILDMQSGIDRDVNTIYELVDCLDSVLNQLIEHEDQKD